MGNGNDQIQFEAYHLDHLCNYYLAKKGLSPEAFAKFIDVRRNNFIKEGCGKELADNLASTFENLISNPKLKIKLTDDINQICKSCLDPDKEYSVESSKAVANHFGFEIGETVEAREILDAVVVKRNLELESQLYSMMERYAVMSLLSDAYLMSELDRPSDDSKDSV